MCFNTKKTQLYRQNQKNLWEGTILVHLMTTMEKPPALLEMMQLAKTVLLISIFCVLSGMILSSTDSNCFLAF